MRRHPVSSRPSEHRARTLDKRASQMRYAPTLSEAPLFEALRRRRLGVTFRRRVPVLGRYVVDLLAPEVRLVVEVDGPSHDARRGADERRDQAIVRTGYHVLRLEAGLVSRDLNAAVERVLTEIRLLCGTER